MGELSILNVGAGDVKISFDTANVAETIRASRIVRDMLRRGYALLVEVERDGEKKFERALDFNENTGCYIVADFDPITEDQKHGEGKQTEAGVPHLIAEAPAKPHSRRKQVPARSTRAVAIARSAGG